MTPQLLVRSFLGNSMKFFEIFDCKQGSGMDTPIKCPIFPELKKEDDYDAYPN